MTLDVVDRVAYLTINRPEKRNAMSTEMWTNLLDHIRWIDHATDVSAVVLQGGGGSFSAGGDLTELRRLDPGNSQRYRDLAETTVVALMDLALPKLAAIDGPCFGAGCSLALACDVRLSSFSSQFGIPALKNGLVYEQVFVQRLVQIVGSGPASLLLYGADSWTADEAAAYGLVDKLTADVPAAVENILKCLRDANDGAIACTATFIRTTPRFN
ncbi:enoyl-CoA hydratase/isomerase family protein [Rhodococcus rhodochrous]|uniref:Enoyl-CoA hydratase/isomerase family protein n=1 Tax=Rhodococcus rhodochrous TaxID=1829 RepID=A0AAW4XPC7_RHORH|nr:enoyl-CoA hydratase/isomerase family protein [Rhodococcus rhodochrous]MCD2114898.1 enoyl-CoA hydratase/isomerase family protein [Rhodococcus rhodochrous]